MSAAKEIVIVEHSKELSLKASEEAGEQRVRTRNGHAGRGHGWPSSCEATSAGRTTQLDPSLLCGRAGRLCHSWVIRGWSARRTVHQDAKEGSTVSGLMDSFATAVSLALQYGFPLRVLCDKFSHTRFEPSGWSGNPKIGYAKSLTDYLFRWLELRFLKGEQGLLFELLKLAQPQREVTSVVEGLGQVVELGDAPPCQFCGSLMVRNGSCYRCMTCGSTSGCS